MAGSCALQVQIRNAHPHLCALLQPYQAADHRIQCSINGLAILEPDIDARIFDLISLIRSEFAKSKLANLAFLPQGPTVYT